MHIHLQVILNRNVSFILCVFSNVAKQKHPKTNFLQFIDENDIRLGVKYMNFQRF